VKPASTTATADGATTRVWEITATESTAEASAPWRSLQLTGVYTKHQSTAANADARGYYEVLTLSKAGEDHAALVISRVQSASPLRVAAR
jgi:CelD/BcsL family acetyltransferase involved in cellulose biosynthesis